VGRGNILYLWNFYNKKYKSCTVPTNDNNDDVYAAIADQSNWNLNPEASYVYYCDNETIDGQYADALILPDYRPIFLLLARYVPNVAKEEYMRSV